MTSGEEEMCLPNRKSGDDSSADNEHLQCLLVV